MSNNATKAGFEDLIVKVNNLSKALIKLAEQAEEVKKCMKEIEIKE